MSDKYDVLKLENQLCFPLYAAARKIVQKYTPMLKELDLTYTQYLVMMVLWECGQISVGELGKKLFLDTGTLSPLLKSMEAKNLLERNRDKMDERSVNIVITRYGESLKEKAVEIPMKMFKCVNLTSEQAKSLYTILYGILLDA